MRASLLALLLLTGCPKAVNLEQARSKPELKFCYQLGRVWYFSDGACPKESRVELITQDVQKLYNSGDNERWEDLTVLFLSSEVADCDNREAYGCTWLRQGFSLVSLWNKYGWPVTLDHELRHYAIYLNGGSEMDHLMLDGLDKFFNEDKEW